MVKLITTNIKIILIPDQSHLKEKECGCTIQRSLVILY